MTAGPAGNRLCRNCGSSAPGNYCPYCGQATAQHALSVLAYVHEIASHYVAVEGRLWQTLALLALQPGRLTHEYLQGRRARYVVPLRLYLTASFLFFAVSQGVGHPVHILVAVPEQDAQAAAAPEARPVPGSAGLDRARAAASAAGVELVTAEDGAELHRALESAEARLCGAGAEADCSWWRRWTLRAIANLKRDPRHATERLAERMEHSLHYAMFLLLPLFAGLLALAYLNRRMVYGEHLVFALHLHSFWFLLSFVFLALPDAVGLLLPVWFLAYGFWALRRVYGGSWGATIARGLAVTVLYSLAIGLGAAALSIALLAT